MLLNNRIIEVVPLFFLGFFFCQPVFAEKVVFKSGKTVEGKLIEKTEKYIKIDFLGVPLTFLLDEIKSIDGKKLQDGLPPAAALNKKIFSDGEWGYSLEYPLNWEIMPKGEAPEGSAMGLWSRDQYSRPVRIALFHRILSEIEIRSNATLLDLTKVLFNKNKNPAPQFIKSVDVNNQAACFIRIAEEHFYTGKEKVQSASQKIRATTDYYDIYVFSPAYSSQGKDNRRLFTIQLSYTLLKALESKGGVHEAASLMYDLNSEQERVAQEAREIIDSFKVGTALVNQEIKDSDRFFLVQ